MGTNKATQLSCQSDQTSTFSYRQDAVRDMRELLPRGGARDGTGPARAQRAAARVVAQVHGEELRLRLLQVNIYLLRLLNEINEVH